MQLHHARRGLRPLVIATLGLATAASAATVQWSGSQGARAASVDFGIDGSDLVVNLKNTSQADVLVPTDVLTAVFFQIDGNELVLSRQSATLGAGSTVLFGSAEVGGNVGGEWAYRSGLNNAPGDNTYGISSSGLNFFGPQDRFPGANLYGPESPGGIEFGIVTAGDDPATGNAPVTGHNGPLIKNEVVFRLGGLPAGFDPALAITSVTFQYGTGTNEPSFPGTSVPTPGSLALLSMSGVLGARRRRR